MTVYNGLRSPHLLLSKRNLKLCANVTCGEIGPLNAMSHVHVEHNNNEPYRHWRQDGSWHVVCIVTHMIAWGRELLLYTSHHQGQSLQFGTQSCYMPFLKFFTHEKLYVLGYHVLMFSFAGIKNCFKTFHRHIVSIHITIAVEQMAKPDCVWIGYVITDSILLLIAHVSPLCNENHRTQWGTFSTSVLTFLLRTTLHAWWTAWCNSTRFERWQSQCRIQIDIGSQTCSVGFMSGLIADHFLTSTSYWSRNVIVPSATL